MHCSAWFFFFLFLNIYLRPRACTRMGVGTERESQADSVPQWEAPTWGLISGSQDHDLSHQPEQKSRVRHFTNWATQAPLHFSDHAILKPKTILQHNSDGYLQKWLITLVLFPWHLKSSSSENEIKDKSCIFNRPQFSFLLKWRG